MVTSESGDFTGMCSTMRDAGSDESGQRRAERQLRLSQPETLSQEYCSFQLQTRYSMIVIFIP